MASKKSEQLLFGTFSLYPRTRPSYRVSLSRMGISYTNIDEDDEKDQCVKHINMGDVVGCRCRRSKMADDSTAYLTIYAYPFRKRTMSSRSTRIRMDFTFGCNASSSFDDNFRTCAKWRNVVTRLARGQEVAKEEVETCTLPESKRLLILINPHSGPGKAQQIFEKEVAPMLNEANTDYEVKITEHAGHATEIMVSLDLSQWYAVIIVSGDGLIYEAINGLMKRPDWERAIQFPVGCLPGGSGNALCWTINYLAGEPVGEEMVLHSTFILLKHRVIPMDLVVIQLPTMQVFSFLSVAWGMIADIDYESEKLRAFGAARFTIYALIRILRPRSYKGELAFLPKGHYTPKTQQTIAKNTIRRLASREAAGSVCENGVIGTYRTISQDSERLRSASVPVMPMSSSKHQYARDNLGMVFDETVKDENLSDVNAHSSGHLDENKEVNGIGASNMSYDTEIGGANGPVNHLKSNDSQDSSQASGSSPYSPNVSCSLLPPLDKPVPSNWVKVSGDFITVLATYQPYLGPDNLFAPDARLNDGCIHLLFIRSGITKKTLLDIFLSIDEGNHINSPFVEYVKVSAFRLTPDDLSVGNLMVDGEHVDMAPVQGQIFPQMGRIMGIQ
ncbi:sphingosine kinase 1-like isoform X2 [Mizuhopecten yessoensis]|uniref:sphingosine kinase n=1 Tax=Mizuhopecten yessoensis TaxID=6573 RepID=A0A210QXB6_MIZYE|nr:sphingosine kinase 1-like isoform X2 [Mizuhopecten yessoensis]OWF53322.1 Sphingosine kinase 2 [Mizuhopecten yessoensis]